MTPSWSHPARGGEQVKITGKGPGKGDAEPVRTTFLLRAAKAAGVVSSVFQVVYYGLEIWQLLG